MADQFITEFNRIMASTALTVVSPEDEIVNDFSHSSMFLNQLMSGKDIKKVILRGGVTFQDWVLLTATGNARPVGSTPTFTITNEQVGTTWQRNWAKTMGYLTWNRDEIDSNVANGDSGWRAHKYKDVWWQKRQVAHQTFVDELESNFVSRPNAALTETLTPTAIPTPAPFFAGINEYNTNATPYANGTTASGRVGGLGGAGLPPAVVDLGGATATTFQNINPTTAGNENWRPYQAQYGSYYSVIGSADEAKAALQLVRALSEACKRTGIKQLPGKAAPYGSKDSSEVDVIYTSIAGEAYFEHLCLTNQDIFRGYGGAMGKDPSYYGPTMHGIPIVGVSTFGDVAFYLNGDSTAVLTELGGTVGGDATNAANVRHTGPRYYGVKGNMAGVSFKSNGMFEIGEVVPHAPAGQPEQFSQFIRCLSQFWLRSRRQHFVVRPDGAATT